MATAGGLLMATAGDQSRLLREAWPRRLNVAKYWLLIGLGGTRLHLPLLTGLCSRPACGVHPYATARAELANGEDNVLSRVSVNLLCVGLYQIYSVNSENNAIMALCSPVARYLLQ